MMERSYDYIFKIVFLGSSSVGKTALLRRFSDDQFQETHLATIGVDFRFKSMNLQNNFIKLQLWDTAGQQRFRTIVKSYYKNTDAVIVVFDIKSMISFHQIQQYWLGEMRSNFSPECKFYCFANKCDYSQNVLSEEVKLFLEKQGIKYFEVSAKTGLNVNKAINQITLDLVACRPRIEEKHLQMTLNNFNTKSNDKSCC